MEQKKQKEIQDFFFRRCNKRSAQAALEANNKRDLKDYPHDLNIYIWTPPKGEMNLVKCHDVVMKRSLILRHIEYANKTGLKPYTKEWTDSILTNCEVLEDNFVELMKSNGAIEASPEIYEMRIRDHFSFFFLSVIHCRTYKLQDWFIDLEVDLFKLRYNQLSDEGLSSFFEKTDHFGYKPISSALRTKLETELTNSTFGDFDFASTNFYAIHFKLVLDLVKTRKVFIRKQIAYVPQFLLLEYFAQFYRTSLLGYLKHLLSVLPSILSDERFEILIRRNDERFKEKVLFNQVSVGVTLNKLNYHAEHHYPLCMKVVHQRLKDDHHLKHGGRVQYLRFLKAIGISFENAYCLWKEEFTKKISDIQFEKQYAYFVKHVYGLVGSRINYEPHSCNDLFSTRVSYQDCHGCPFNNWDTTYLKQVLEDTGMSVEGIDAVTVEADDSNCQLACAKYYEYTHEGNEPNSFINSPLDYYNSSVELSKIPHQPVNEEKVDDEEQEEEGSFEEY